MLDFRSLGGAQHRLERRRTRCGASAPAGGLIQMPELINGQNPEYPQALIGTGKDGSCVLIVDIDDGVSPGDHRSDL